MKILLSARGEGKTKACVEYLRQHPTAVLLVATERAAEEARRNFTMNESYLTDRIRPWDWFGISGNRRRMRVSGIILDNADLILESMFECPIEAISMTWPKPTPTPKVPSWGWAWP